MKILHMCLVVLLLTSGRVYADPNAQYDLASDFYAQGNYPDALSLLIPLAETGDARSQNLLGYM